MEFLKYLRLSYSIIKISKIRIAKILYQYYIYVNTMINCLQILAAKTLNFHLEFF
jgi:hypothetical protein